MDKISTLKEAEETGKGIEEARQSLLADLEGDWGKAVKMYHIEHRKIDEIAFELFYCRRNAYYILHKGERILGFDYSKKR